MCVLCCAEYDEPPPLKEVMDFLATWDKVPKEQLLAVFERGHFAGVDEMKRNERLFNRVAPMGVNDIAMACQYKFTPAAALTMPVISFEGLADNTIDPGAESPATWLASAAITKHVADEANGRRVVFGTALDYYPGLVVDRYTVFDQHVAAVAPCCSQMSAQRQF